MLVERDKSLRFALASHAANLNIRKDYGRERTGFFLLVVSQYGW